MSDALPDSAQAPPNSEPEARPPVPPPLPGMVPAWVDPAEQSLPVQDNVDARATPRRLTLEPGGRSSITGTAERIGTAVGVAQRQVRRGLQLVRSPQMASATADAEERASQIAHDGMNRVSRVMEDFGEEVSDFQQQAARRLDEWSDDAGKRFQELRRRARTALYGSRKRAQEIADAYPLQTIAAIAGVCFALGVALRLGRSHRG